MKKLLLILGSISLLLVLSFIGFLLIQGNSVDNTTLVSPLNLPANGVHVSSYVIDEAENIIRVEIIANIADEAAGFDLSLAYDASALTSINTDEGTPALLGDLFVGARSVRNLVEAESDSEHIRMMYVFFGTEESAEGGGTLAIIDFQVAPNANIATINLQNARLSRINEDGIAEYIPLNIGDPSVSIFRDEAGIVHPLLGFAPERNYSILLIVAIGMLSIGSLGLFTLGIVWLKTQGNNHPRTQRA